MAAAFLLPLAVNLALVWSNGLPPSWTVLAVLIAPANPLVELDSPRGMDDFAMATTNALICLGFGSMAFRG